MVRISTRIDIEIARIRDEELERKIAIKPSIRLITQIKFPELEVPEDAILDTGAHISVIPLQIWKRLDTKILVKHKMKGIVPDHEIPVNVGYVKAKIVDRRGNESTEMRFLSCLAFTNKIPLILGLRDMLENFDIHIKFSSEEAFLEMK